MLRQFVFGKPSVLDEPIADLLTEMNGEDKDSERYKTLVYNLDSLMQMKAYEGKNRVSPDALFSGIVTFSMALLFVSYEHKNVISTKALMFLPRPK